MKFLKMRNLVVILAMLIVLAGCRPYIVDVEQGNIIDSKVLSQIHPGLSKDEVKTLLGTPILVDPFDPNVWLYAHTRQTGGGKIGKNKVVLKFKNDKLVEINR